VRFDGQIALITGGSSGIGLSAARMLSARGAHVWLMARDRGRLEAALEQVQAASANSRQKHGVFPADVSVYEQADSAVQHVSQCAGFPNLLINCAGATHPGYFQELDLHIFRSMMEINYFGTVNMAKAVVPGMIQRRSGHIVNVASMAGILGIFGYTAYSASKFAVRGFSDVLRAEMKPLGVRVSIVYPSDTDTPQLAYEKRFKPYETEYISSGASMLSPDDVAHYLLRGVARNRYIIIPGFECKVFYWLSGLVGTRLYPIMDILVARAQRKKHKQR
jgi:3-dehydrosphinganine reductase